jgi:hypothetical protein
MFTRIVKNVVVVGAGGGAGGPDEYRCGYEFPEVYTLDAGNQPGTQVLDVRWEYAPFQPLPEFIQPPFVDVVDDTHISLACKAIDDVSAERVKVRIIIIIG